jgi:hypothetical protein
LKSGWDHIQKHQARCRAFPSCRNTTALGGALYFLHKLEISASPGFSVDESKHLVQITYYFGYPLGSLLNPCQPTGSGDSFKNEQDRDEFIDLVGQAHTLADLNSIYQRFRRRSPIEINNIERETAFAWRLLTGMAPGDGDALLSQTNILLAVAEAAISWHGGGSRALRKWPPNLLGLRRFLLNRGKGSLTESDLPDRRLRTRTPFPSAMNCPSGRNIDVSAPILRFAISEDGTLGPLMPGEQNLVAQ